MGNAITVKGQVTIPKALRDHMGIEQGQEIEFVAQPNGQVLMFPAKKKLRSANPFAAFIGKGVAGLTTEQLLNQTRGKGWNK